MTDLLTIFVAIGLAALLLTIIDGLFGGFDIYSFGIFFYYFIGLSAITFGVPALVGGIA